MKGKYVVTIFAAFFGLLFLFVYRSRIPNSKPLPQQALEESMGIKPAPHSPQGDYQSRRSEECFETDAKQPFKFEVCYTPLSPYRDTSINVVVFPETPIIQGLEFFDLTRKVGRKFEAQFSRSRSQKKASGKSEAGSSRMTFKFADLFSGASSGPTGGELKLVVKARSNGGIKSEIQGTLKFGK